MWVLFVDLSWIKSGYILSQCEIVGSHSTRGEMSLIGQFLRVVVFPMILFVTNNTPCCFCKFDHLDYCLKGLLPTPNVANFLSGVIFIQVMKLYWQSYIC